jgi:excisionase family DNA binding protein
MSQNKTEWVRPKTAAKLLGVSVKTIRRWAKRGLLPARKIGGAVLVRTDAPEEVEERPYSPPFRALSGIK